MIRLGRSYSSGAAGTRLMAVFAAGLVGGGLIVLTVQSRPAPAVPAEAPPLSPAPIARAAPAATHPAEVLRVIDGDTFEARVHVWPGLDITTKIRLRGIDAPELRAKCAAERTMAEAARDALGAMLAEGTVGISGVTLDKYGGRVVADAGTRSIANVSSEMLAKGHARRYAGGRRDDQAAPGSWLRYGCGRNPRPTASPPPWCRSRRGRTGR
jgi:endonuclease YncB( thermonuclease family)